MVIMMVVDNFGNFEIMCRGMSDLMKNAVFLDYKYRHDRNHFQPEQIFQNERQHQMTVDAVAQAVQSSAKNKVGIFQIYTTYLCSHVSAFIFICGIPILRTVSSVRQNCFSWILKYVLVDIANFDLVQKLSSACYAVLISRDIFVLQFLASCARRTTTYQSYVKDKKVRLIYI